MAASSPSPKPSSPGDSYIGSVISLISKYEIRYEGVLYLLNVQDSTIGLKNVRSHGTEGRKSDGPQIPPSDKLYEFILFRGSDIKDLQVKSSPPPQTEEQFSNDPAIIQSQYPGNPLCTSPLASVGGRSECTQGQNSPGWQNTPALTSRAYSSVQPPCQYSSQATQNAVPSSPSPIYWQGYNGMSISTSQALQHSFAFQIPSMGSSPLAMQNQIQPSGMSNSPTTLLENASEHHIIGVSNGSESPIMGVTNLSAPMTPVPSVPSNPLHPKFSASHSPIQYSTSLDMPFTTKSIEASPQEILWSNQGASTSRAQNPVKNVPNAVAVESVQSMPYPASSTSSSLLTPLPLLSPDQLAQSRPVTVSAQNLYLDQNAMPIMTTLSSPSPPLVPTPEAHGLTNAPPLLSIPASQEPLLPLPGTAQQHDYLSTRGTERFTEEFDFEAMNEKFKKDEVWGYLGKAMQRDKTDATAYNATDKSIDKESPGLVPNVDAKPAYKKDEFFDTISCNSLSRGRNGQNRFSERMRLDTETFGSSHQRFNLGYGAGGSERGDVYHGSHNRGRGYGYGGRWNGSMPF